jgi:hypothetical protein
VSSCRRTLLGGDKGLVSQPRGTDVSLGITFITIHRGNYAISAAPVCNRQATRSLTLPCVREVLTPPLRPRPCPPRPAVHRNVSECRLVPPGQGRPGQAMGGWTRRPMGCRSVENRSLLNKHFCHSVKKSRRRAWSEGATATERAAPADTAVRWHQLAGPITVVGFRLIGLEFQNSYCT